MGILQLGLLLVACNASGDQVTPGSGATPAAEATAAAGPTATAPAPAAARTLAATPAPRTDAITPAVTTVSVTVEVTRPPLGTAGRPVQLLFPPVAPGAVIMQRAEPLAQALRAATGMPAPRREKTRPRSILGSSPRAGWSEVKCFHGT